MLTLADAKKMFSNLQVESATGTILFQQGIFTHAMEHRSIASWYFGDTNITIADGRAYYWGIESMGDGFTYKTVDDITDILSTRDMIIERSLRLSIIGFLLIVII